MEIVPVFFYLDACTAVKTDFVGVCFDLDFEEVWVTEGQDECLVAV